MSSTPIYVRIRRKHQTFFVFIDPTMHGVNYLKKEIIMALSGFNDNANNPTFDNDDDDDDNYGTSSLPVQDLKIMNVAGVELKEETDLATTLVNDQELHVVFRIADDEYEPVQIQYADNAAD
ncbi:hypothetical protein MHU86_11815 [Fragilaria crotonensis]|nr:hypothetical protein MHU86_11815 [Fragilaria crotonensis]